MFPTPPPTFIALTKLSEKSTFTVLVLLSKKILLILISELINGLNSSAGDF